MREETPGATHDARANANGLRYSLARRASHGNKIVSRVADDREARHRNADPFRCGKRPRHPRARALHRTRNWLQRFNLPGHRNHGRHRAQVSRLRPPHRRYGATEHLPHGGVGARGATRPTARHRPRLADESAPPYIKGVRSSVGFFFGQATTASAIAAPKSPMSRTVTASIPTVTKITTR